MHPCPVAMPQPDKDWQPQDVADDEPRPDRHGSGPDDVAVRSSRTGEVFDLEATLDQGFTDIGRQFALDFELALALACLHDDAGEDSPQAVGLDTMRLGELGSVSRGEADRTCRKWQGVEEFERVHGLLLGTLVERLDVGSDVTDIFVDAEPIAKKVLHGVLPGLMITSMSPVCGLCVLGTTSKDRSEKSK